MDLPDSILSAPRASIFFGLSTVVVDVPGMALELLAIGQGLHLALDRLVLDLSVRLAQPVAVRVDALLASLTMPLGFQRTK